MGEDATPNLSRMEGQVDVTTPRSPYTSWTFTLDGFTYLVSRLDFDPVRDRWMAVCGERLSRGTTPELAVENLAKAVSELPDAPHKRQAKAGDTEPVPEP